MFFNDEVETCKTPVERAAWRALSCPDALIGGLMTYLKHETIIMFESSNLTVIIEKAKKQNKIK
jgi:hypothetical protein